MCLRLSTVDRDSIPDWVFKRLSESSHPISLRGPIITERSNPILPFSRYSPHISLPVSNDPGLCFATGRRFSSLLGPYHHRAFNSCLALLLLFSTHLSDIADDSEWLEYSSDLSDGYIELLRVPSHLFGRPLCRFTLRRVGISLAGRSPEVDDPGWTNVKAHRWIY